MEFRLPDRQNKVFIQFTKKILTVCLKSIRSEPLFKYVKERAN